ncbi:MAG: T9SS type A sorting domain-containing protein [Bacteroidota bacterium]
MKIRVLLILMLGLVGMSGKGQLVTFEKTYSGHFSIVAGRPTPDGGFIMAGRHNWYNMPNYCEVLLVKVNSNGDTVFAKTYRSGLSSEGLDVWPLSNGGYVILGDGMDQNGNSYALMLVTDSFGNIVHGSSPGLSTNGGPFFSTFQETNNHGYLLGLNLSSLYTGLQGQIIRTDSNWNIIYTKQLGIPDYTDGVINFVRNTNDNGFLAGCKYQIYSMYLVKGDSSGNPIWEKTFTGLESITDAIETNNGEFIVIGTEHITDTISRQCIVRLDSLGHIIESRSYNSGVNGTIHHTNDGGYIIGTMKTDQHLNLEWAKLYNGFNRPLEQTTDGGYAFSKGLVIKTDSYGNSGCLDSTITPTFYSFNVSDTNVNYLVSGSPITISNTGSIGVNFDSITINILCFSNSINEIIFKKNISISPNPFSTQATLRIEGIKNEHYKTLSVYNVLGMEMQKIEVGNGKEVVINRNNLSGGMYFYKLMDENKTILGLGKMIIEQ